MADTKRIHTVCKPDNKERTTGSSELNTTRPIAGSEATRQPPMCYISNINQWVRKGVGYISRRIKAGVMTIQPFKCILKSVSLLLSKGHCFRRIDAFASLPMFHLAWTMLSCGFFSVNKSGGSWKLLVNPVHVQSPQSLRQVQPICEFTANNSCNNMKAAVYYNGSPCRADMEDVLHRRAILLHVKVGAQSEVALVVNTNPRHHHSKPMSLTHACHIREYAPMAAYPEEGPNLLDGRVAQVDFNIVHSILLMYNTVWQRFDRILFSDASNTSIATLTLTNPIAFVYRNPVQSGIVQYLFAGIFTGDLGFFAHFLGQQGASLKSPCVFCLARQDQCMNLPPRRKSSQVSKKKRY